MRIFTRRIKSSSIRRKSNKIIFHVSGNMKLNMARSKTKKRRKEVMLLKIKQKSNRQKNQLKKRSRILTLKMLVIMIQMKMNERYITTSKIGKYSIILINPLFSNIFIVQLESYFKFNEMLNSIRPIYLMNIHFIYFVTYFQVNIIMI